MDEFTALRQIGFEPVGQVAGSVVRNLSWWYKSEAPRLNSMAMSDPLMTPDRLLTGSYKQILDQYVGVLTAARRTARDRMAAQCARLGSDGVVAVTTVVEPFRPYEGIIRFTATGTAVRARGVVRPPWPFVSHLPAQDFAKLIGAGWVPVDIAVGISVFCRANTTALRRAGRRFAPAQELRGWTELVSAALDHARIRLWRDIARVGADGAVMSEANLDVYEKTDTHVAEATYIGTAITNFGPPRKIKPPSMILRLS